MQIEELPVGSIKPYEKNPRKNDGAVNGVAESIKQFGFQQPIVIDKNGVIVAGHTRHKAALKLGLETVPCVRADQLSPKQVKAYRILDNKLNELATWDFAALGEELKTIKFDFSTFGVDIPTFDFSAQETSAVEAHSTGSSQPSKLAEQPKMFEALAATNGISYGVYVEVESEEEQKELYERLTDEGYSVRTTTI